MTSPDTSLWQTEGRPIFTLPRLFSLRPWSGKRVDLLGGVQPRFGGLALAAGVFLVAIFFLFQALFNQKVLIGQQTKPLRQVEGLVEAATGLVKSMEALEPGLHRLNRADGKELADFRH